MILNKDDNEIDDDGMQVLLTYQDFVAKIRVLDLRR